MIDLHTHTTASDGQYTPSELVNKVADKGLSVLAITDHDTIDGIEEGAREAKKRGITFVPGIELNIQRPGCEFHLLGLGLNKPSKSLNEVIQYLINSRKERNDFVIEQMNKEGIEVTLEEIQSEFPGQVLGRPHFAAWLEAHKIVKHRQQAFDKYLARGRPWYVERTGANLDEAIQAIFDSGGVPVVAHPMSLYLSWSKIEPVMEDFKQRGIVGLECFHPGARVTECLRLEELARKLGFIVTAGSDFHGEKVRADRKPGHTCGGKKIEDKYWFEELQPALEKYRNS
ncbi:MAG: PHP domain-containing protein [Treponema sp.]|nr:PHP domain-containing protein [Treponema sp.]